MLTALLGGRAEPDISTARRLNALFHGSQHAATSSRLMWISVPLRGLHRSFSSPEILHNAFDPTLLVLS